MSLCVAYRFKQLSPVSQNRLTTGQDSNLSKKQEAELLAVGAPMKHSVPILPRQRCAIYRLLSSVFSLFLSHNIIVPRRALRRGSSSTAQQCKVSVNALPEWSPRKSEVRRKAHDPLNISAESYYHETSANRGLYSFQSTCESAMKKPA